MNAAPATKRAFIVLGAESSGTRLLTSILITGGCHGSIEHAQPIDDPGYDISPYRDVVWRRSVPHNGETLDLPALIGRLNVQGEREIIVLSIHRDKHCNAKSQVWWGHANDYNSACERIDAANRAIDEIDPELERVAVSYETFVNHPERSQRELWSALSLTGGVPVEIRDGNEKYLGRVSSEVSR